MTDLSTAIGQIGLSAIDRTRIDQVFQSQFLWSILFPLPIPAFELGLIILGIALFRARPLHTIRSGTEIFFLI